MAKKEPDKSSSKPTKAKAKSATDAKPVQSAASAEKAPKPTSKTKKPVFVRRPLIGGTPLAKYGVQSAWRVIDAKGVALGRLSSRIASMLMGKDKPIYTRFIDAGDHVIVINAEKVVLTGNKWADKTYNYHTNYPGGIKAFTAREIRDGRFPDRIVRWAVYGMLPKGHMGRRWYKKLYVYAGDQHPHAAQKPIPVSQDGSSDIAKDLS